MKLYIYRFVITTIVASFFTISSKSQTTTVHHPQLQFILEDSISPSSLQPYEIPIQKLKEYFGDTHPDFSKHLYVTPALELSGTYHPKDKTLFYRFGQGFYCTGNITPKAGFELSAVLFEQSFPDENKAFIDSLQLIPRFNRYIYNSGKNVGYLMVNGFIYWSPIKWLTLKAGNDKNFIGDGHRSLFLSENAASYPFLQTRIKVWKIDYMFQNLWLRDLMYGFKEQRFQKYAAMHVMNFTVATRANFYIYESVIWRKQDTTHVRSFDIQYLNPFLFFRPAEFNIGSPDNVLMGIGGKYRIGKNNYIYAQLLIDEFRFQELQANKGWWGNKYAYQIGIKKYGLFYNKPSLLLFEYNNARPFTWSHSVSTKNYGYLRMPLAHPLGSNFREFSSVFRLNFNKKWLVDARLIVARYGTDSIGSNFGSDIYKPQWSYTKYEGNYTTQGIRNDLWFNELTISRIIVPAWRLQAGITITNTILSVEGKKKYTPGIEFELRTLLYE